MWAISFKITANTGTIYQTASMWATIYLGNNDQNKQKKSLSESIASKNDRGRKTLVNVTTYWNNPEAQYSDTSFLSLSKFSYANKVQQREALLDTGSSSVWCDRWKSVSLIDSAQCLCATSLMVLANIAIVQHAQTPHRAPP